MNEAQFPGYKSEREVKRFEAEKALARKNEEELEKRANKKRAYDVLMKALPVLREHGQSLALPAEMPRRFWFSDQKVTPAWIVSSYMTGGGEATPSSPSNPSEVITALTFDGCYGEATMANRGVEALKFWKRPLPLNADLISNRPFRVFDNKLAWQVMEEEIASQLGSIGIKFSFDTES